MPNCPQCNKPLAEIVKQCPSCRADLSLLVNYVAGLSGTLERADQLTRQGELAQAFWIYLEVLEVDPDNPIAKRHVGQIATAVRQFDRSAPARRWAMTHLVSDPPSPVKVAAKWAAVGVAILAAFLLGYFVANRSEPEEDSPGPTKPPAKFKPLDGMGPG